MPTLRMPRRDARGFRAVLLAVVLAVSVLAHHGIGHNALMAPAPGAMPSMSVASPDSATSSSMAASSTADERAAMAFDVHGACVGDQMCVAAGVAKSPGVAHVPTITVAAALEPGNGGTGIPPQHDAASGAPPGAPTVLRI